MSDTPAAIQGQVVEHATCTACGCLCDDIAVAVQADRIVGAQHACLVGTVWFLRERSRPETVEASREGRSVSREEALAHAVRLIQQSRAPLVLGLSRAASETTAAALALGDRIGAVVDTDAGGRSAARLRAFQRVGRVSATLGEVKNRADVVVFWNVDPVTTHPRHFERYSVEPHGRFLTGPRTIIATGGARTATAERADLFLAIGPERQFEILWTLRALLRGVAVDPGRALASTGLELPVLSNLAERLKQARYGAWFCDPPPGAAGLAEAMLTLVRDLNEHARFVLLNLGAPGNPTGAEAVTAWQTGFAGGVAFTAGGPCSWPGETDAESLLARAEADLAIVVADDVGDMLSDSARAQLARIPRIVIAPSATEPATAATVGFATATAGIDAAGTVTRTDGVVLPLRPALPARFPSDRDWLRALREHLDECGLVESAARSDPLPPCGGGLRSGVASAAVATPNPPPQPSPTRGEGVIEHRTNLAGTSTRIEPDFSTSQDEGSRS